MALYRIHALCLRLHRYCYVKLFDTEFDKYFGYADGKPWGVNEVELASYSRTVWLSTKCTSLNRRGDFIERLAKLVAKPRCEFQPAGAPTDHHNARPVCPTCAICLPCHVPLLEPLNLFDHVICQVQSAATQNSPQPQASGYAES